MKIILDTNILFNDLLLIGSQLMLLEKYLSWNDVELCIPEVVIQEIMRHFRKKYEEAQTSYTQLSGIFSLVDQELEPVLEAYQAVEEYKEKLFTRLSELNVHILPLPSTSIESLLSRDIDERKPFDTTGKGFRDTLIWESILEDALNHDRNIVLITNDNDFSTKVHDRNQFDLHDDLKEDLEFRNLSLERFLIKRSLHEFNNEYVLPLLERVYKVGDEMEGSIVEGIDPYEILLNYGEAVARIIHDKLPEYLSVKRSDIDSVSFIRWPENVKISKAFLMQENEVLLYIHVFFVFDTELFAVEKDLHHLLGLSKGNMIMILNHTWDVSSESFHVLLRVGTFAEIAVLWNTKENIGLGVEINQLSFTKNGLK